MTRDTWLTRAVALAAGLCLAASAGAQQAAQQPVAKPAKPVTKSASKKATAPEGKLVLEPRAIELLKAVSDRLAAAKSMSFTAVVGYEYPSQLGPPIVYTLRLTFVNNASFVESYSDAIAA